MKKLLIYGSMEFAGVVRDLSRACDYECAGYIDDYAVGGEIIGDYEHVRRKFPRDSCKIAVAVGYKDLKARWAVYEKVLGDGYDVPTIIHPRAYVRDISAVGRGSIVMAGAIVDFNAKVGELCVLWPGTVVNHDSTIGDNTFLSPNSTVCGCAEVMGGCFIGAGAVIVDHVTVPYGSFVKAGRVFTGR